MGRRHRCELRRRRSCRLPPRERPHAQIAGRGAVDVETQSFDPFENFLVGLCVRRAQGRMLLGVFGTADQEGKGERDFHLSYPVVKKRVIRIRFKDAAFRMKRMRYRILPVRGDVEGVCKTYTRRNCGLWKERHHSPQRPRRSQRKSNDECRTAEC